MRIKNLPVSGICLFTALLFVFGGCTVKENTKNKRSVRNERGERRNEGGRNRALYEFKLLRDPKTGIIPIGIRKKELELLKTLPSKNDPAYRGQVNNTYSAVGPTQNGGRTRAVVFDVRYNGSTNKVIMAGGVNGGIFRSTDGGATWAFVSPENEIRSVSCIAQDPRPGSQDIWYAGTGGEVSGASAADPSTSLIPGFGIYKSVNNGATWTRLTSTTASGVQNPTSPSALIDNNFDMVYRILVHPTTGNVYAAIQNTIVRSTDGGSTWGNVLVPTLSTNIFGGMTELAITANGARLFAAFSGRNGNRGFAGIFTSTTGNSGSWTKIAGGLGGATDSVAGWKAYNNSTDVNGDFVAGWGRIVLATAPSNNNLLYAMYYNTMDPSVEPEADLFKADLTSFNGTPQTITWNNYSANLVADLVDPDLGGGFVTTDYYNSQGEYDMCLAIHPTNPGIVIAGGVNLYLSTDGFSTGANVKFIGGYPSLTYNDPNFASHPDHHALAFDPSSPNRLVVGCDGGMYATTNVTASTITWGLFNSQYQTFQYYYVAIDPEAGSQMYAGGAQDNSTSLRDPNNLLGQPVTDPNDHLILIGGDGCSVGLTKKNAQGKQFLFASAQYGQIFRQPLNSTDAETDIKPSSSGDGQFVTYFHLDDDNTNNLYYASDDILYRTTSSTTVTTGTWTEMTGVTTAVNGGYIFSMATTRGNYSTTNSYLFMGTDFGEIFRLKNPANATVSTEPDNISPPTGTIPNTAVITGIAVNPRSPDTVMFVVSNYGVKSIFWSGNATSATPTWQSVEGNISLPSVRSCAIVVKTTGVEYYVGTSIGLFSTTAINGTSTVWASEGSGMMKAAIVNDLAYRWQDNTMLVGTHGNGMFVTNIGNAITGVNNVVRNDKNFIKAAYPTVASSKLYFQTGNVTGVRNIQVELLGANGQLILKQMYPFRDGSIPVSNLANGNYIINITSDNRKYVFTQQFVKIN